MMLIEATGSTLNVRERYLVRNSSSPPRTQFSQNGFEIVLPEGAVLEEASATRPGGLGRERILLRFHKKGITRSTSQASPTRERRKRSSKCSIA